MNTRFLLLVLAFFLLPQQQLFSQFGFSHEIGVIAGPAALYSDFGQRNDNETNTKNSSFGIGIIHYLNFSYRSDCNCYTRDKYFNDHFKVRTEIDYNKTKLEHHGRWVRPEETGQVANQLRAMKGETRLLDIGAQLEYFPFSIRDFAAGSYKFAPFISFGVHWVSYDPNVYSELGPLNNPITTPEKYMNAFRNEGGTAWSIVGSVGVRYKLAPLSDLMLDLRWQHYFSNWIDGLNPDVPENKANEWLVWLNFGYIYYID